MYYPSVSVDTSRTLALKHILNVWTQAAERSGRQNQYTQSAFIKNGSASWFVAGVFQLIACIQREFSIWSVPAHLTLPASHASLHPQNQTSITHLYRGARIKSQFNLPNFQAKLSSRHTHTFHFHTFFFLKGKSTHNKLGHAFFFYNPHWETWHTCYLFCLLIVQEKTWAQIGLLWITELYTGGAVVNKKRGTKTDRYSEKIALGPVLCFKLNPNEKFLDGISKHASVCCSCGYTVQICTP